MVRKAEAGDLARIEEIYTAAQSFMRVEGNPNQWNTEYPIVELMHADFADGHLYVVERSGIIAGVFMFATTAESYYERIYKGAWSQSDDYGVIHRVASKRGEKRILAEAKAFAIEQIGYLRMDTHPDNKIMQKALLKNGFSFCGEIVLPSGDLYLGYDYIK